MNHSSPLFKDRINPHIEKLQPYIPGKPVSELQREFGLQRISKLASNENPLGASPMAKKAVQDELLQVERYPDGNAFYLRDAIASFTKRDFDEVAVGNGSNELLELVARVFAGPGDEVVFSQYAFAVYPISALAVGATPIEVPAKDWSHDLEAMLQAITDKTKIVYIANPNNPTGTCFEEAEWLTFISKVPKDVIVVLDEAYFEYVALDGYANGIDYLDEHSNLLISRTFSKAYGLASLRVGYMLGCSEIISYINRLRAPFNVNSHAQVAAVAALKDQSFVVDSVRKNEQGMQQLIQFFDKHQIEYIPSYGNFVCFNAKQYAESWNQIFLEQGVILRPVGNYGMKGYIRVSIGGPSEIQHFLAVLTQILKEHDLAK